MEHVDHTFGGGDWSPDVTDPAGIEEEIRNARATVYGEAERLRKAAADLQRLIEQHQDDLTRMRHDLSELLMMEHDIDSACPVKSRNASIYALDWLGVISQFDEYFYSEEAEKAEREAAERGDA